MALKQDVKGKKRKAKQVSDDLDDVPKSDSLTSVIEKHASKTKKEKHDLSELSEPVLTKAKKRKSKNNLHPAEEKLTPTIEEELEKHDLSELSEPLLTKAKRRKSKKNLHPAEEKLTPTIEEELVSKAVDVLRHLVAGVKPQLLEDVSESFVMLQVTMRMVPHFASRKIIKIDLPHTLAQDTTDVCLFTGDLDKSNRKAESDPVVLHYKELLKKHGVKNVSEVIPLRQLRTEYKTYESQRQLVAAYDVFLCDSKIAGVLPRLLGKFFFKKRKFPLQIRLGDNTVKSQIDKALSKATFFLSCRGNSCTSEVACLNWDNKQIASNVLSAVDSLGANIPGKWENIKGLYLKTAKSKAIPIYLSQDDGKRLPRLKRSVKSVEGELSTMPNSNVRVMADGRVITKKIKLQKED